MWQPASTDTRVLGLKGDALNLNTDEVVTSNPDDRTKWSVGKGGKVDGGKSDKLSEIGHGQVPFMGADAPAAAVSFARVTQRATASGQASEKRRRLDELTSVLQRGDRLVVSELSRLGRSLGQVVAVLDALAKAGVAFVALKENIRVEGKRDIQTKVMTTLFALFAEVERDLISERTREGLARARSSGRKLGRPKGSLGVSRLDGKEDEIRRFLELGVSKTAIAKLTGVSRTALYSFMTSRGLRPSP